MMLNKNKVEEVAESECLKISIGKNGIVSKSHIEAFKTGVSYAESKLSELAIEFAEWIDQHEYIKKDNTDEWVLWDSIIYTNTIYTSKELFQEFLKYKNG